jgi:hypothetical protein
MPKNQTSNTITIPRTDVAELKEKIQAVLSLILPTRPNETSGITYLIPTPSQVQNGAFALERVLQSFPFCFVGTKRQEQLKASRNRNKRK